MEHSPLNPAEKFDASRAGEYARQSRIALAGYDACHELAACVLAASLGNGVPARILVVGVGGTAQEIILLSALEPAWTFVGVDPSPSMLETATEHLKANGLLDRTQLLLGTVDDLPNDAAYDAATLIGVLHHVQGDDHKRSLLRSIQARLKPDAPLIVAANHYAYAEQPFLLKVWGERWRQQGATSDEVKAKLGKILQGADPPRSEEAVQGLLHDAGFGDCQRFFSSLFWGAWVTSKVA
ncbi:tRNA (cmo5U34)-methyltransferase [Pseudomonas duriflava]|uniref:tRNA (Cmo5U34)-methyltransferase n=1 Tax=Pseudomonas duriflava TaxID=459528 RepID=A0A562QE49_9PSED|nr:class I SAM-dependent methyltransferase [Pseudomonas duriflava]TWI55028.1 tRNA (cmo5U34)-methyltransferase [Pseudomonas duriflava]